MKEMLPILHNRRERRLDRQRQAEGRRRSTLLSLGMLFSLGLAALILGTALAYADLTRDLPSVELLPRLLDPARGLLLQPTRIYDRTGQHLLVTFAPEDIPRQYIALNRMPPSLADGVILLADPGYRTHSGYSIEGWNDPDVHPTIAQRLVSDLLLYDEPPSTRRAIRERILAAQLVAQYGHDQVLEWYLNSTHYGRYAYGAGAAAQLYFGRPAGELNLAEAAILAAVSQSPSLNPLDAPEPALQRGRELIQVLESLNLITPNDADRALAQTIAIQPSPSPSETQSQDQLVFVQLALSQIDSHFSRERLEFGGLTIFTTLDFDLQTQASCVTTVYAARLAGGPDPESSCGGARLLPALPPNVTVPESVSGALILDPTTGQVLALTGDHVIARSGLDPGSLMTPFIYLTGFTRGLSPSSLVWDIPGQIDVQNFDGIYHGPMRARLALANDYRVPAETMLQQMGPENVARIAESFGVGFEEPRTMLDFAGAYGAFSTNGVYFGQEIGEGLLPAAILRVESADGATLLDWSTPEAQSVVSSPLAYLITDSLSDEAARRPSLGSPNVLEIGRPVAAKLGQLSTGESAWAIGYTPYRVVVTRTESRQAETQVSARLPAALWNALMQLASEDLPRDGWPVPQGVTVMNVCDPSGLLPSDDCPTIVSEVFASGSEPTQPDTLFHAYEINRETGYLATVFTPPQLIERRVYMGFPPEAKEWAVSAGLDIPPDSYDAIQPPPRNPTVNITSPDLFAEVNGVVPIMGTAAGDEFVSYRLQVGQGLNPAEWLQIGEDETTAVEGGLLAEWDTEGLSGLYAVRLIVVREDQRLESAVIQVTVGNP